MPGSDRRRVHAHHRRRTAPLDVDRLETAGGNYGHRRGRQAPHPRTPDRRRRPGTLPAHQVRRPEALLAGRRRRADPAAGRPGPPRRRRRVRGHRGRHGPPRPPQRAGEHLGKSPRKLFDEFEGKFEHAVDDRAHTGDVKYHMASPPTSPPLAAWWSPSPSTLAPGDRGPGGRRQRAFAPAPPRRQRPRRCRRCCCTATPRSPARALMMELFQMSQARGFRVGGTASTS